MTALLLNNGGDLMLGYGNYDSNELTKKSVTQTVALRRACQNILFTVANSGYYGIGICVDAEETAEAAEETVETVAETPAPAAAENSVSNMDRLFRTVNISGGIILALCEAALIFCQVRSLKKKS